MKKPDKNFNIFSQNRMRDHFLVLTPEAFDEMVGCVFNNKGEVEMSRTTYLIQPSIRNNQSSVKVELQSPACVTMKEAVDSAIDATKEVLVKLRDLADQDTADDG